jgi:hypothetical protein
MLLGGLITGGFSILRIGFNIEIRGKYSRFKARKRRKLR